MSDGFVYIVATVKEGKLSSPIKVGITQNLGSRVNSLKTASAYELKLYKHFRFPDIKIAEQIEQCFFATQRKLRMRGEWFDLDPQECARVISVLVHWSLSTFTDFNELELIGAMQQTGAIL